MTKVQRYKVGYYTDEWGMSSNTPCLVPDDSGYAVKFEDCCKLETEIALLQYELAKLHTRVAKLEERRCEVCGYAEHHREHTGCLRKQVSALKTENETAWAQAHRLALELECLLLDTKDNATVSKWWDSGMEALDEYQQLKPGAAEEAEAWAKMRKETL